MQSELNPWKKQHVGVQSEQIPWTNSTFGAERTKSLGQQFRTPRVWIGILVRYTIQVKFRRELFIYAVTVGKFSGINFVSSYSFRTFKNLFCINILHEGISPRRWGKKTPNSGFLRLGFCEDAKVACQHATRLGGPRDRNVAILSLQYPVFRDIF